MGQNCFVQAQCNVGQSMLSCPCRIRNISSCCPCKSERLAWQQAACLRGDSQLVKHLDAVRIQEQLFPICLAPFDACVFWHSRICISGYPSPHGQGWATHPGQFRIGCCKQALIATHLVAGPLAYCIATMGFQHRALRTWGWNHPCGSGSGYVLVTSVFSHQSFQLVTCKGF